MAKKPRKVYNAALGRMVSLDYADSAPAREQGKQVYFDGADVDRLSITQQVIEHPDSQFEKLEQAGSEKFDELFHSIYDAVMITDMDGNISLANARAEHNFGWSEEDLMNMSVIDLISGADSELMQIIRRNVSNKKFTVLEAIAIRSDGSRFNADIVANRLMSHKSKALCFFIRDVTLRKQAEDGLKKANDMLIEAEKVQARIDTISTLLHGFNNPMQILMCMAEMDENQEYKKQLDRIMALLTQLNQEQSLEEIIDPDGSSRYDIEAPADLVEPDMDRILIVDDEETLRGIFVDALTTSFPGKTIDPAGDGKTALELFAMRHHGVIVLDVNMPIMNGEEAFREMELVCSQKGWVMPHVIFCTGFVISEELKDVISEGDYHAFLQKPLSLSSMVDMVSSRLPA